MSSGKFPIRFHDPNDGAPPVAETLRATVSFVDTGDDRGMQLIRQLMGPTADETLARAPGRYVMYVLNSDFTSWSRVCPTEDLVLHEAVKLLRVAEAIAPGTIEVLLFLDSALRHRVSQAVVEYELLHGESGGSG